MKSLYINILLFLFILSPSILFAQVNPSNIGAIECEVATTKNVKKLNYLLMSQSEHCLTKAIYEMNRRQAAVSYNVANASTPGFKPIRFPDEIDNAIKLYGDASLLNQVHLDDEMVKATHIRLKHSAYIRLLTTKMQITRKVVTLNKGG